jgi:hypothetical protein
MNNLLYPGDAARVPNFMDAQRAIMLGAVAAPVVRGINMVAELRNVGGDLAPGVTEAVEQEILYVGNMALRFLSLTPETSLRATVTYQNGPTRRFGWHPDETEDIRLLVNAGTEKTKVLLAPVENTSDDVFLGYEPQEEDIEEIEMKPGDAYILDNRVVAPYKMLHSTEVQEGRVMIRIDLKPDHIDPIALPVTTEIIPGMRMG